MRLHELKCWPGPYAAIAIGIKKTEVRRNGDRDFRQNDLLMLREWDPVEKQYTGAAQVVRVTHIEDRNAVDIPVWLAVMSIEPAEVVPVKEAEIPF